MHSAVCVIRNCWTDQVGCYLTNSCPKKVAGIIFRVRMAAKVVTSSTAAGRSFAGVNFADSWSSVPTAAARKSSSRSEAMSAGSGKIRNRFANSDPFRDFPDPGFAQSSDRSKIGSSSSFFRPPFCSDECFSFLNIEWRLFWKTWKLEFAQNVSRHSFNCIIQVFIFLSFHLN